MNWEQIKNFDVNDLRNLDVNNIGSWPTPARVAVLILAFALVAGGGWWYLIKDKLENLEKAERTEQELKQEFAGKQAKAANLEAYKAQLEEMQRSFGAMLRQLPGKTEVDNLLVDISQTALASGLQQQLFKPESEVPKDFYAELPVKMRYTGSFHEFGTFTSGVAALPRIVTLHDITIKPVGGKQDGAEDGPLVMEVTAKTYRYLDDQEQSAQEAANKGGRK
jgi:type IV pilus assembly protein PilO